jgi:hypothetical protein
MDGARGDAAGETADPAGENDPEVEATLEVELEETARGEPRVEKVERPKGSNTVGGDEYRL